MHHTPWGPSLTQDEHGEGITFYSTSGHGGYHVTGIAEATMRRDYRELFFQYAPSAGWYEEDCAWAAVALAFPERFSGRTLRHAIDAARRWFVDQTTGEDLIADYWSKPAAQCATEKADAWESEQAEKYERTERMAKKAARQNTETLTEGIDRLLFERMAREEDPANFVLCKNLPDASVVIRWWLDLFA